MPGPGARSWTPSRTTLINLRGEVLPFLRLREVFAIPGRPPRARERGGGAVRRDSRAGIVVDQLLGEFQTVIKPLGKLFRNLKGVGGSTILGTGEVALILDVPQLVQLAATRETQRISRKQANNPADGSINVYS